MAKANKVVYIACQTCSLCKVINPTVSSIAEKAGVPIEFVDAGNIPSEIVAVLASKNASDLPIILVYRDEGVEAFFRSADSKIDLREFERCLNGCKD